MCYPIWFPDTTPIYGAVGKDGKQSLSVYEKDGARHVYIADKSKVDEFTQKTKETSKHVTKGFLGILGGVLGFGTFSTYLIDKAPAVKKWGIAGLAVGILSSLYTIAKIIDTHKSNKETEKILDEIRKGK